MVAGAKDDRFNLLLQCAEARETNAPTIVPEASSVTGTARLAQHLLAREHGDRNSGSLHRTPGENGLEARRRLVQRFDPLSAHANLNLMSKILRPPKESSMIFHS